MFRKKSIPEEAFNENTNEDKKSPKCTTFTLNLLGDIDNNAGDRLYQRWWWEKVWRRLVAIWSRVTGGMQKGWSIIKMIDNRWWITFSHKKYIFANRVWCLSSRIDSVLFRFDLTNTVLRVPLQSFASSYITHTYPARNNLGPFTSL